MMRFSQVVRSIGDLASWNAEGQVKDHSNQDKTYNHENCHVSISACMNLASRMELWRVLGGAVKLNLILWTKGRLLNRSITFQPWPWTSFSSGDCIVASDWLGGSLLSCIWSGGWTSAAITWSRWSSRWVWRRSGLCRCWWTILSWSWIGRLSCISGTLIGWLRRCAARVGRFGTWIFSATVSACWLTCGCCWITLIFRFRRSWCGAWRSRIGSRLCSAWWRSRCAWRICRVGRSLSLVWRILLCSGIITCSRLLGCCCLGWILSFFRWGIIYTKQRKR